MNQEYIDQQTAASEQPQAEKPSGYPLDWNTTAVKLKDGRFVHILRRPSLEQILARDEQLQTDIPIGRDGSYQLPDPTATEDIDAKYYDAIVERHQGYGENGPPASHKSAAFKGLYQREIYVDEETDIFADEIPVIEEVGGGADPDFTIVHVLKQADEADLKRFRRRSNSGEVKPGKRGRQRFVTKSNLKLAMEHYAKWLVRIEGAMVGGQTFYQHSREEFIAHVDPLVQQRVVNAYVEALAGGLLD